MTEVTTTFGHKPDTGPGPSAAPVSSKQAQPQALITKQQVLFGTAAAVPLPPAKTRRFSDAVHAVRAWLMSAAQPPARPVYPMRHDWLESALMSREMDRL